MMHLLQYVGKECKPQWGKNETSARKTTGVCSPSVSKRCIRSSEVPRLLVYIHQGKQALVDLARSMIQAARATASQLSSNMLRQRIIISIRERPRPLSAV